MRVSDRGSFAEVIERAGRVFGRDVDAELIGEYWRALDDLPLRRVRQNAEAHIREGRHFPRPRELRYSPDGEVRRISSPPKEPPPQSCDWQALANRWLLAFLMRRGVEGWPVSDDRLGALVREKCRLAADMATWPGSGPTRDEQQHIQACALANFTKLAEPT